MQVLRSDLRYVEVKILLVKLSSLAPLLMLQFFSYMYFICVVSGELINTWTEFALTQMAFYLVNFCTLAILKKFWGLK